MLCCHELGKNGLKRYGEVLMMLKKRFFHESALVVGKKMYICITDALCGHMA